MKRIFGISVVALLLVTACGDDTTDNKTTTTNNNTTSNNTVVEPTWILNVDGQAELSGSTTKLIRTNPGSLTVQFSSTAGTGQITIEGLAEGDVGTFAETVTTQFTGFPGAPNCGFSSNGDGTAPPLEIVITENDGTNFVATYTFTELTCSMLTGGGEAPNASGNGQITKN